MYLYSRVASHPYPNIIAKASRGRRISGPGWVRSRIRHTSRPCPYSSRGMKIQLVSFGSPSDSPKYRDPLHGLLEYLAEVNIAICLRVYRLSLYLDLMWAP